MTRITLAFLAFAFIFSSCKKVIGTGPTITETRSIADFNAISLEMNATVNITQGTSFKVEISAQKNVLDDIQTTKSGSTLRIKHKNNMIIKGDPITITITMPNIVDLDVSGSGNINVKSILNATNLDLEVSGSGEIMISSVIASSIKASISGSGDIGLASGTSNAIDTEISGSGTIDMLYVVAQNVTTETAGSGATKIQAENTLDSEISGSGNVYYKGNPSITKSISGSGKLINQN